MKTQIIALSLFAAWSTVAAPTSGGSSGSSAGGASSSGATGAGQPSAAQSTPNVTAPNISAPNINRAQPAITPGLNQPNQINGNVSQSTGINQDVGSANQSTTINPNATAVNPTASGINQGAGSASQATGVNPNQQSIIRSSTINSSGASGIVPMTGANGQPLRTVPNILNTQNPNMPQNGIQRSGNVGVGVGAGTVNSTGIQQGYTGIFTNNQVVLASNQPTALNVRSLSTPNSTFAQTSNMPTNIMPNNPSWITNH